MGFYFILLIFKNFEYLTAIIFLLLLLTYCIASYPMHSLSYFAILYHLYIQIKIGIEIINIKITSYRIFFVAEKYCVYVHVYVCEICTIKHIKFNCLY